MSKIIIKYNNNILKRSGNIITGYDGVPITDFNVSGSSASQFQVVMGNSLNFYNLSTKNPTSWNWLLGTGVPSTSTLQNPTGITFNTTGLTNISLTTSNAFGSNTKTKTDYISVISGYKKLAISFYAENLFSQVPYYSAYTWTPTGMTQRSWTFNMLPTDKLGYPPTTGCTMALKYTDNTPSNYRVRIFTPFSFAYSEGYQTGNDTGIYPDEIMLHSIVNTSYPIVKQYVRLSGFTESSYKLTFFCSRVHGAYPPTSIYTITGGTSKDGNSVAYTTAQSDDNYLLTYSITGITPSATGIIDVAVDYTINNGMLTAMEIEEEGSTPVIDSIGFIAATQYNSAKINTNGKAWSWGYNLYGLLGDNTVIFKSTPIAVCGNHTFCQIAGGNTYLLGIDNRGKLWSWGKNNNGQLGDKTVINKSTPIAVCGNHTFCQVSKGGGALALDNRGKAWSWGFNLQGELGDNTTIYKSTPVAVYGNKTFCKISAGVYHSIGIDKNGKTWGWGYNRVGELGDNTIISKNTPIAVCGNKTFCQISTGEFVSLGIDIRGKAWSWGNNDFGQLGDNTITCRPTPVAICGNKTFCLIIAGYNHSSGIDKNGKAWSWGRNSNGESGNNTTENRSTPVAVCGNHTFCQIFNGEYHSIGLDKNDKAWGWGTGYDGQLGDNTTLDRSTPVAVCTI